MAKASGLLLNFIIFAIPLNSVSYGLIKCLLKSFENCDQNGNDAWKFNLTIKSADNKQYIDGSMLLERPLDNTIRFNTSVVRLTLGKYIYLFSFYEEKACDGLNRYLGEGLYDLERMAQVMPGLCPIEKGTYHWHNAPVQLEKIPTLASFPFGTLRFIDHLYDKNNNFFACLSFEAEIYM